MRILSSFEKFLGPSLVSVAFKTAIVNYLFIQNYSFLPQEQLSLWIENVVIMYSSVKIPDACITLRWQSTNSNTSRLLMQKLYRVKCDRHVLPEKKLGKKGPIWQLRNNSSRKINKLINYEKQIWQIWTDDSHWTIAYNRHMQNVAGLAMFEGERTNTSWKGLKTFETRKIETKMKKNIPKNRGRTWLGMNT